MNPLYSILAVPILVAALSAPAQPAEDGEYAPVTGMSAAEREAAAMLEDRVAKKVARDHAHVVWAYGVLWSLFCAYGLFLWRRGAGLRADVDELRRALGDSG